MVNGPVSVWPWLSHGLSVGHKVSLVVRSNGQPVAWSFQSTGQLSVKFCQSPGQVSHPLKSAQSTRSSQSVTFGLSQSVARLSQSAHPVQSASSSAGQVGQSPGQVSQSPGQVCQSAFDFRSSQSVAQVMSVSRPGQVSQSPVKSVSRPVKSVSHPVKSVSCLVKSVSRPVKSVSRPVCSFLLQYVQPGPFGLLQVAVKPCLSGHRESVARSSR